MTDTPAAAAVLDPAVGDRLADVARARGSLWGTVADLLDGAPALVDTLRSGVLPTTWRAAAGLFAGQTPAADRALLVLGTYAAASRHRTREDDGRTFAEVHAGAVGPVVPPGAGTGARAVAALCADEAAGWAEGDAVRATAARRAQLERTGGGAVEEGAWAAGRALAGHASPAWRALGALVQTFVATETGRAPVA